MTTATARHGPRLRSTATGHDHPPTATARHGAQHPGPGHAPPSRSTRPLAPHPHPRYTGTQRPRQRGTTPPDSRHQATPTPPPRRKRYTSDLPRYGAPGGAKNQATDFPETSASRASESHPAAACHCRLGLCSCSMSRCFNASCGKPRNGTHMMLMKQVSYQKITCMFAPTPPHLGS